jgi:hypothetical protein
MLFTVIFAAASVSCAQISPVPTEPTDEAGTTIEGGFGASGAMRDGNEVPPPAQPNGLPSAPPALMPGAPDADSTIG